MALAPYHFQPGQSGNPAGSSKARREQMAACETAALAMVPEAIVTLTELMRHSVDDRVRTRCAEILLERGLGKPREAPPPESVEETLREPVRFVIDFVRAEPSEPEEGPVIEMPEPVAEPEPSSLAPPVYFSAEEIAALEAKRAAILAELEAARREANFAVDDEFDFST